MKVGIYTRSATGDTTQLREQEQRCREHALAQGWDVVAVWSDSGSGLEGERSGLRALREAMAARQLQTLLVTDATRLGRDHDLVDQFLGEAEASGATVIQLDCALNIPTRNALTARMRTRTLRDWRGA